MKNAGYTAAVLLGGYQGNDGDEIFDRAEAQYREALRKEPHHVGFLTTLADMVLEKGDIREADMLCRRAIYFDSSCPFGFATLARVYVARDQPEHALDCYKKALALREIPDVLSNMVS
jgi:Tfp pilus assembly protein PilF